MLWLDDLRPAPEGWVWCKSVAEALRAFQGGPTVSWASLDHDLGDFAHLGGDGTALVDWMAETDTWPTNGLRVHSANPVGKQTMLRTVDAYSPFEVGYSTSRGQAPPGGWPVTPPVPG